MARIFIILVLIAAAVYFLAPRYFPSLFSPASSPGVEYKNVKIGNKVFKLEAADTEAEQNQGLSGRRELPENQGMIFIFDEPGGHGIWMKGMKFPLDIIWLKNNRVVQILENVQPDFGLDPQVYYPEVKSDAIIELNAGMVEKSGLMTDDLVSF